MSNTEKYDALVGKVLDNRYKILEKVGEGGMSVVLKAEDIAMSRTVAIKVLNDESSSDENAVRRFVNESKAVAMLSHPNIMNIYDVAFEGKMKYIVMEYIDGISLNDYLVKKRKLPWRDAVHFADQILMALEHAHEKGIVHRDVKPQNIMLLRDGTVKVADFGIAKLPNIETKSVQDKAIGTVYYMSPEQACGQSTGFASDIYSLGIVLYEMTTGCLPFDGDTALDIATKQVNEMPKEPRSIEITIPRGLEQIILKAMEKKPGDRYESVHKMRRAIQILRNNPSIVFAERSNRRPETQTGSDNRESGDNSENKGGKIPVIITPVNAGEEKKTKKRKTEEIKKSEKKKKPASKSGMFPIILGVALAFITVSVIGVSILAMSIFESSDGVGKVYEIPEYVGMEYNAELRERIVADELILRDVKYEFAEDGNKDYVIAQNPVAGSTRKSRDLILTVSLGSETLITPDFTVKLYTNAEVSLRNMGLVPVIERVPDLSVMENYVIRTEPARGEIIKKGDKIVLYVSDGDGIEFGSMPDVVGMEQTEAQRVLTENGVVKVKILTAKSGRPDGEVIEQDVAKDTEIPKGNTEVTLVVSEYDRALDPDAAPADLPVSATPEDTEISGEATDVTTEENNGEASEGSTDTAEEPSGEATEENAEPLPEINDVQVEDTAVSEA